MLVPRSEAGRAGLAALRADPSRALVAVDYDGTLAPIVDDPTRSALPEGVADLLAGLAHHLGVVAIVSGRPAAFLADRAAIAGVRLLGLYGTQEWRDNGPVAHPAAAAFEPALDDARERLTLALAGHPGIVFEDKGLAVALHWRNAEDRAAAGRFVVDLVEQVAAETGLAHEPGKFVAEVRPPLGWDKGTSVSALCRELALTTVVYVGDDLGDLPGLAAAQAAGGIAMVVDHGEETPPEVRNAADVVLESTPAVAAWLATVAAAAGTDAGVEPAGHDTDATP